MVSRYATIVQCIVIWNGNISTNWSFFGTNDPTRNCHWFLLKYYNVDYFGILFLVAYMYMAAWDEYLIYMYQYNNPIPVHIVYTIIAFYS